MSSTAAEVGQRIRAARAKRGLSQAELAARMTGQPTPTALSYWESGRRSVGLDDLVEIARVLSVAVSDLLPDPHRRRPVVALLRAVAEDIDGRQLADEIEAFAAAAEKLPRPRVQWEVAPASPRDTAEALLIAAGVKDPPVSVRKLVSGCGIVIQDWDFSDVDGLMVDLEAGPVIWVNDRHSETRRRFTLAHELGHKLLQHFDRFHVEFGNDLSQRATGNHPEYDWRAERAANDFAANLLMPATMVREAFVQTREVSELARTFKVSPGAMKFRLINLRLTGSAT
ncbi:Zn-dependent peptidase ImmA (M78 family)/transcriptional regulator with XRE-family HTH domain [Catenulispora sp. GAS73]|uniref:helix-turn-helix domain-containing protein n=1 Tax=Catenulispora sp. GAS73 TaxID=3156269 RepID=UPI003517FAFD